MIEPKRFHEEFRWPQTFHIFSLSDGDGGGEVKPTLISRVQPFELSRINPITIIYVLELHDASKSFAIQVSLNSYCIRRVRRQCVYPRDVCVLECWLYCILNLQYVITWCTRKIIILQ